MQHPFSSASHNFHTKMDAGQLAVFHSGLAVENVLGSWDPTKIIH